ncbi:MAG TPA: decarboxylating 6-phosphogluconate dehydrogenase [Woeseiaceae bacterium]|nr:decarboxylating 6-phosphogluconate dehydrogenase [Woeseiaceae bacterium]
MRLGMIGLGRMGAAMVERLLADGHECVVYDRKESAVAGLVEKGASGARSVDDLIASLTPPRAIWMMVPVAVVGDLIASLQPQLAAGDTLIDGGNSWYRHAIERADALRDDGIHYLDVGVSGGVFGLEHGYCLMVGGERTVAAKFAPVFATLAPPSRDTDRSSISEPANGFLYCGASGAGHFVKMVHNGIEYGLMAAYAEGFNLLAHADIGNAEHARDAETAPLMDPRALQYELDTGAIAELWRHASVVRSWLLDLTAEALKKDARLTDLRGTVADSGEGRWTLQTAVDAAVPMPVLSAALFGRFTSRERDDYANRILSAMRRQFGGHEER